MFSLFLDSVLDLDYCRAVARKKAPPSDELASAREVADALAEIFPEDYTTVQCLLCTRAVFDIDAHLRHEHPKVELATYISEYPGAKLRGQDPPRPPEPLPPISSEDVAQHPGGYDGARVEGMLAPEERPGYLADVTELAQQYEGAQIAKGRWLPIAYLKIQSRRLQQQIDRQQQAGAGKSGRPVLMPAADIKAFQQIEAQILSLLKDLDGEVRKEKDRQREDAREREEAYQDNPVRAAAKVVEDELAMAETWVRSHIGEFTTRCASATCGAMLLLPGLPHWAYAPIRLVTGETSYAVWSPELWKMVCSKEIRLWHMAFALRTSPEGLRVAAERRLEPWPDTIDLVAEERLLRAMIDAQEFAQTHGVEVAPIVESPPTVEPLDG